jgi:hypothetical protein
MCWKKVVFPTVSEFQALTNRERSFLFWISPYNIERPPPVLSMNLPKRLSCLKAKINQDLGLRRAFLLAILFFTGVLLIALNRYYSFYASYDHGLFNQLFWNSIQGNFFQSSLTSANSAASLEDGVIPIVSFIHLGQHFVIDFLLWLPLYVLFPHPVTLIVLQVGLMAIAGLVLYHLARHYVQPALALWITSHKSDYAAVLK